MRILTLIALFIVWMNPILAQEGPEIYCAHAKISELTPLRTTSPHTALDTYDVKFYFLDLEADNLSTFIKSNVSITAQVVNVPLSEFVVELVDVLQVDSVYLNGSKATFIHQGDEVSVTFPTALLPATLFTVTIYYQGNPQDGGFFSGISNTFSTSWGNQVTWTLSEPLHAKEWFPCKQVLEDKADSVYVFITVPDHLKAGSNGLLTNSVVLPGNRLRFEWKSRYPIAYYLISMAIASYVDYSFYAEPEGTEPILVQNFVYDNPATLPFFKNDIDEVKDLLELFSTLFGPYPFHEEKYGHCMTPFSGGMEHQTMTSLGSFNFTLDAHELGHQWFGNNVTCSSWQDIWVNEGFARYTEYLGMEYLRSKPDADAWMSNLYTNVISQPSGSVYVPAALAQDENRIFNGRLTYNKGGALIHMIRNIINDDAVFFDLLKTYQIEFAGAVASGDDFKELLKLKSGIDFDEFFNDWYYGEGYPLYNIEWNYFNDSIFVKQIQTTSHPVVNLYETPLEYKLRFTVGDTTVRFTPTQNEEYFQLYMPAPVTSVVLDPNNWLLKKVSRFVRNEKLTGHTVITGVETALKNSFSVYPNPAREKVNITFQDVRPYSFILRDLNGRLLIQQTNQHQHSELNTYAFAPGLYILQLISENYVQTQKLRIE